MKKCPFCAEEIQDAAVVCKHCHRDLAGGATVTPKPKPRRLFRKVLIGVGLLLVLAFIGQMMTSSTSPPVLTAEHQAAIEATHAAKAWLRPKSIELRSGIVVVDYEVPTDLLIQRKTFGETRLLAIRDALLPFGFTNYRVNVNGPTPGAGLVQRLGSARFLNPGPLEWITP